MPFLTLWGQWLPADLHLASDHAESIYLTANLELLLLLACAFLLYLLLAIWLLRHVQIRHTKFLRTLLWIGAIVAGIILVVTPEMASRDLFARQTMEIWYGVTGPTPISRPPIRTPPHDILTIMDTGWSYAPSAYGPVWIAVTMFFSLLFGTHPLAYFYAYRSLGLICHLINIWLIGKSLRMVGRSERIVLLGMVLYAWNRLALFENSFGAHNDAFMSTLILCGVYLSIRADQRGFTKLRTLTCTDLIHTGSTGKVYLITTCGLFYPASCLQNVANIAGNTTPDTMARYDHKDYHRRSNLGHPSATLLSSLLDRS